MTYVALLRGINVGGKNKVEMARLRGVFETLGHLDVRTYINSGNLVFNTNVKGNQIERITQAIEAEFGFRVEVLVKDIDAIEKIERALPEHWVDDKTMRTYVMFLWDDIDSPAVLDDLPIRDDIDSVIYVDGAIIWHVERENITRSGMNKMASGALYKQMTIRNANTVRKIATMMRELAGTVD